MELAAKRVTVTGSSGFLGRHVVERFRAEGAEVSAPRSKEYDLTDLTAVRRMLTDFRPEIVVHAAADVGGIEYNRLIPADISFNNLAMSGNMLKAAAEASIAKLVIIGSACAYPGEANGLMQETDLLRGPLHASVECYGFSKRALLIGSTAFREQYGLNSIFLTLTNLYGPGDKMDPEESHVVAALVRKFVEARKNGAEEVVCWGTGAPVREFLYVEDCAEAIALATSIYDKPEPLNIGTGIGTSIRELAEVLADISGFSGSTAWDTSRPNGTMDKVLDVSRMKAELGWMPKTTLIEGLRKMVAWYAELAPALT